MRRGMWMVWLWAAGLTAGVFMCGPAGAACFTCGMDMSCTDAQAGGRFCFQAPSACSIVMACASGGGGPLHDPADPTVEVTSLTVLEDAPAATFGAPARLLRHAGSGAFGRAAARLLRTAASAAEPDAGVVTALLGFGDGGEVAFRTPAADGFTFERRREAGAVHVTIRELVAGRPGSVLAQERLGDDDLLLVRVRIEGRPRLLALQSQSLPGFAAAQRLAPMQDELRAQGAARPGAPALFTLEAPRP